MPSFHHYDLALFNPTLDSPLVDLVIELEHLRKKRLMGTTHPRIFFQLKHIFHILESIGSARIEGNNTTVAEYIEETLEERTNVSPSILEIKNIEGAMDFVEENIDHHAINRSFVSEIHKKIVENLAPPPSGEGDLTPGEFRKKDIKINKSEHVPPDVATVNGYMDELFDFINTDHPPKYDLIKAALAHHRFVWVHPFGNGNGRTVRLFTYAMLVKLGFNVANGRILNPTAVFCNNREDYYHHLSLADTGTVEGLQQWCIYVLKGLKEEIEKIDRLLDNEFLKANILVPAINHALERHLIIDIEHKILKRAINNKVIKAGDLKDIFVGKHASEISRQIAKLIDKKMLRPESKNARSYIISFDNSFLFRGIVKALGENGFLPEKDAADQRIQ